MFEIITFWLMASVLSLMTLIGPWVLLLLFSFEWLKKITGTSTAEQKILNTVERGFEWLMALPFRVIGLGKNMHGRRSSTGGDGETEAWMLMASLAWCVTGLVIVYGTGHFTGDLGSRFVQLIASGATLFATHLSWLGLPLLIFFGVSILWQRAIALYTRLMPTIEKIEALGKDNKDA